MDKDDFLERTFLLDNCSTCNIQPVHRTTVVTGFHKKSHSFECKKCAKSSIWSQNWEDAIAAWNKLNSKSKMDNEDKDNKVVYLASVNSLPEDETLKELKQAHEDYLNIQRAAAIKDMNYHFRGAALLAACTHLGSVASMKQIFETADKFHEYLTREET